MEYVPGDPVLIKNIVTQLKSQGIFDQIRKECIVDVDTKPAYQNLCHRADTQVSKFLSKVKWGPDLHKNQTRENIRRQVNECSFVEPGIAIIVDQLVNPRINTVLVPKVEDMLYKYLGIPREMDNVTSQRKTKSFDDKYSNRDISDSSAPISSKVDFYDKKKETEKYCTSGSHEHSGMENQKNDGIGTFRNDSSMNKIQSIDEKSSRDKSSNVKTEPFDNIRDSCKSIKTEPDKHCPKVEMKEPSLPEFDSESSDDEMSPPFEPNEKSDNDMSIGSGDSNFSEIIFTKPPNEPEIPGVDDQIDAICKADESKIITEHEDSMDSVRSSYSTPSAPEKIHISPIEIPKTPTINYETSDDSDDYVKNKKLDTLALDAAEPTALEEVPEVNFEKIEKVLEDNTENKIVETPEIKPPKEDDKYKDKNRSDDAKKKSKYKDDKPVDGKEKHTEKKSEHRGDKDRKSDKHRSEQKIKDREKERHRHDSTSSKGHSRKDDKSHHSRDHSRSSDHDRKSKSEHKKDDYKKDEKNDHKKDSAKSEHKKDDRGDYKKDDKSEHRKDSRSDRKKEDDKKHSRDDKDKDRKKDSHKVSSSDDKKSSKPVKTEDSKHKYDKPRDDKKSSKNGDNHKSKKKDEDSKKSRSQCNIDEKKKTDRRSSDRDSSGPSSSNSSSIHHSSSQQSSRTDKDKGSGKHRHSSSSSSSHKTKKNNAEDEKNRSEKLINDDEKNPVVEDDLEQILESSPDKGFQNNIKSDANFSIRKIILEKTNEQSNDHIEDMMNEMFQPTKPVLKKPKIAKNFADIRRIMKLRKLYEEDFKSKGSEQNASESTLDADTSTAYKIKLRKTVDYFVMRRFGKNGNNYEKCKELTNAIIETLTDVKLNITRIDRRYSLVDGSCTLSDDETDSIFNNNVDHAENGGTKTCENEVINNISIIEDERANLILEDLANSYTDPNFKLGNVPHESKLDRSLCKLPPAEEDTVKIVQSEIKANGAKMRLPKQLTPPETDNKSTEIVDQVMQNKTTTSVADEDDASLGLKLKIKSFSDGNSKTWQACDHLEQIPDPVRYLPLPNYNSNFMQFANELLNELYNFEVENLTVEMDYPEFYDSMFVDFLGAKVMRKKSDDPKTSPIKYNSEIINKKLGDKSIMLRIKKTAESEESADQRILNKKRKLADDSGIEVDNSETCTLNSEPVKKKKKTLGIKRTFVNPLKMKLTSGQLNDTISNDLTEKSTIPGAKTKTTPVPKKSAKVNKAREMSITNANHKKSESESSDGRRSSVSSMGTNSTHSKDINESITPISATAAPTAPTTTATAQPKNKTKNITLNNDTKTDTVVTNANEGAPTKKMVDPPTTKKASDTKNAEEKRKQSIMNCYYDESDLYKPRPSLRLTSRRHRLSNADNI